MKRLTSNSHLIIFLPTTRTQSQNFLHSCHRSCIKLIICKAYLHGVTYIKRFTAYNRGAYTSKFPELKLEYQRPLSAMNFKTQ